MTSHLRRADRKPRGNREFPHDWKALTRLARSQGWTVSLLDAHRSRFVNPQGKPLIVKVSKELRGVLNAIAKLRQLGLRSSDVVEKMPVVRAAVSRPQPTLPPLALASQQEDDTVQLHNGSTNGHAKADIDIAVTPKATPDRRRVLLRGVERTDLGNGVHAKAVIDHMHVHWPELTVLQVQNSMCTYCTQGFLTRRSDGRYSLSDEGRKFLSNAETFKLPRKPSVKRTPDAAVSATPAMALPTTESVDDDVKVLDAALATLADVERVIRRHRDIAVTCAQLKQVLNLGGALK